MPPTLSLARAAQGTAAAMLGLTLVGAGHASNGAQTFGLKAVLDAHQQIPLQAVPTASARGVFSGTLRTGGSGGRVSWRLTVAGLTGRAVRADIRLAGAGKVGRSALTLCAPCRRSTRGTVLVVARVVRALERGGAYVEVHTLKNPRGETRGQITRLGGA
jgi:hypothetical protein